MKISLLLLLSIFCFSIFPLLSDGQKLLQIEKRNSLKTQRYYIGDEVIFQLAGDDDYWYRERIVDVLVDANSVLFTNRVIDISKITKIRSFKDQAWSRGLSNNAFFAAGGFTGLSLMGAAFTEFMLSAATVIIPGVTVVVALAIRLIFRRKTYRMGKQRRLRVLDLNFYKVGP